MDNVVTVIITIYIVNKNIHIKIKKTYKIIIKVVLLYKKDLNQVFIV